MLQPSRSTRLGGSAATAIGGRRMKCSPRGTYEPAALVRQGKDPQLDKAIEAVMAALAKKPVVMPKHPAYPNYQKKTATDDK